MKSFHKFISESSRSSKRNLRIIGSTKSTPDVIRGRLEADTHRDEYRSVVRGVRNYVQNPSAFQTTGHILKSGGTTLFPDSEKIKWNRYTKMGKFVVDERLKKQEKQSKALETKYRTPNNQPGNFVQNVDNYINSLPFSTTKLPTEGPQGIVHRTLASIDPKRKKGLERSVQRLQTVDVKPVVSDSGDVTSKGTDFASSLFNPQSPNYAFDPKTPRSRVKWRNFFKK
jgi:hypothetical protein